MAPIAAAGVWADKSVPVNVFDSHAEPEVPATPKGKRTSTKMQSLPSHVQDAVITAKVNGDVGNNIRWEVIMQSIQEIAPAPPRHVTPVMKLGLPVKSIEKVLEDSTSAGETTDSDLSLSDTDSPKARFQPPPGLSMPAAATMQLPPGLSTLMPPPGLEDVPPPPGFEFGCPSTNSTPDSTPKASTPPWRKANVAHVAEKATSNPGPAERPWRKRAQVK